MKRFTQRSKPPPVPFPEIVEPGEGPQPIAFS
jgi:hypothetical protein